MDTARKKKATSLAALFIYKENIQFTNSLMNDSWHYYLHKTDHAPVASESIKSLIFSGQLQANDHVREASSSEWQEVGSIPEFACLIPPGQAPALSQEPKQTGNQPENPYANPFQTPQSHNLKIQSSQHAGMRPESYLWQSICATLLCCLPFGVVGIVYAAQVDSKWYAGQYDDARRAAQNAKTWTLLSFWIGIGVILLAVMSSLAGM